MSESIVNVTVIEKPVTVRVINNAPTVSVTNAVGSTTVLDNTPTVTVKASQVPTVTVVYGGRRGALGTTDATKLAILDLLIEGLDATHFTDPFNTDLQFTRDELMRIVNLYDILYDDFYAAGVIIEQTDTLLRDTVYRIDHHDGDLAVAFSQISQTADDIILNVNKLDYHEGLLTSQDARITLTADAIQSQVILFEAIDDRITQQSSLINQTAASIISTVARVELTENGLTEAHSFISQTADRVDTYVERLGSAENLLETANLNIAANEISMSLVSESLTGTQNTLTATQEMLTSKWSVLLTEDINGIPYATGFALTLYPEWIWDDHSYIVGDKLWYDAQAWNCIVPHNSTIVDYPGASSGYWEVIPGGVKTSFGVAADEFFVRTPGGSIQPLFLVNEEAITLNTEVIAAGPISSSNYEEGVSGYKLDPVANTAEFYGMIATFGNPTDIKTQLGVANGFVGVWSSASIDYEIGDEVLDNGSTWYCILAHTSDATTHAIPTLPTELNTYWVLRARAGDGGSNGLDGFNNTIIYLYKRATSTPAIPTGTITYTFSTAGFSGITNSWSNIVPSGTDDLYVIAATAVSREDTDDIEYTEWSTPVILTAEPGADGDPGLNSATVYLFQRTSSDTAPSKPSVDTTFTFITSTLTGVNNGWTQTMPTSGGTFRWMTTATAVSASPTDTILSSEWADVALLAQDGVDGDPGLNGTRTAILDMYKWLPTTPTTFPAGSSTYTWSNGQFTNPATLNGWYATPPAPVAGSTLWMVRQTYADTASGATSNVTWSATSCSSISLAGANGANGQRIGILEVYKWAATAPALPSGTSTYTWATGVFDAPSTPNGWSLLPGAPQAGLTLWGTSVSVSNNGTSPTSTATWTGGSAYAVGAAGSNGINSVSGILSNETHAIPATVDGTPTSYVSSGTDIQIYEGATLLDYDGVGTSAGKWKVDSVTQSNITKGTLSSTGITPNRYATYGDASALLTDSASLRFNIVGKSLNGTAFTLNKLQTFSKAKAGATGESSPTFILLVTKHAFLSLDGTIITSPSQAAISFQVNRINSLTGTAVFAATGSNGVGITLGGVVGSDTRTLTTALFGTNKYVVVTCTIGAIVETCTITLLDNSTAAPGATVDAPGLMTPGTTTINGGLITTHSITANKLNVTELSAVTATAGNLTINKKLTMQATSGEDSVIKCNKANFSDDATPGYVLSSVVNGSYPNGEPKFNIGDLNKFIKFKASTGLEIGGPIVGTVNIVNNAVTSSISSFVDGTTYAFDSNSWNGRSPQNNAEIAKATLTCDGINNVFILLSCDCLTGDGEIGLFRNAETTPILVRKCSAVPFIPDVTWTPVPITISFTHTALLAGNVMYTFKGKGLTCTINKRSLFMLQVKK